MRHLNKHTHVPGRHCASTSVADLLCYHDIHWGEAMCFGLGGGLGIWYVSLPDMSPSRLLHVRSEDFERRFFERIGTEFAWQRSDDPAVAESSLKRALAEGRPAILLTDLYCLPYYKSKTHFPAHCILAWGYDEGEGVFFVSDTEREGTLPVSFADMRQARVSVHPPTTHQGDFFAPGVIRVPNNMDEIIVEAIVENARRLKEPELPYQGLQALDTLGNELRQWGELNDWRWAARFMYQIVEKRGTGGGGFRLMYADFLDQAVEWVPRIAAMGLPGLMRKSGRAWSGFARALKTASDRETPEMADASSALATVIDCEQQYVAEALQLAV